MSKALTLTQPWAAAVAYGYKRVETRSWPTSYRGLLYIHSSKALPRECKELLHNEPAFKEIAESGRIDLGCIVAVCRLDVCVPTERFDVSNFERQFGDYTPGRFAWMLGEIRRFVVPMPARGALGLWDPGSVMKRTLDRAVWLRVEPKVPPMPADSIFGSCACGESRRVEWRLSEEENKSFLICVRCGTVRREIDGTSIGALSGEIKVVLKTPHQNTPRLFLGGSPPNP